MQKVAINFKQGNMPIDEVQIGSKLTNPIDETRTFSVKPLMAPPPPYWLIIPIGIVFVGLFYLGTRK